MKHQTAGPILESLRAELATALGHRDTWRRHGNDAQARRDALRTELANAQRDADPAKASALAKATTKHRAGIAEEDSAIADAHDQEDRLDEKITILQQRIQDLETIEDRQVAHRAVVDLVPAHASRIERSAADLIAALRTLHDDAAKARTLVESVLQALHPDPMIMEDMRQLVLPRASATGPEIASAIAAILYAIAQASGAELDAYVTFNEFNRGAGSITQALNAGAATIASRLKVEP